jgi:hypothetical protein
MGVDIVEQTLGVKLRRTANSFEFEKSDMCSFEYTESPYITDYSD